METIYYATSNKDKIRVAQNSLGKRGFVVKQLDIQIPEIQSMDPQKVAKFSASWAADKTNKSIIKNDVGFFIEALGGFPGPFIKYFHDYLTTDQIIGLYKSESNHSAYFTDALAFCRPGQKAVCFVHKTPGRLIDQSRGKTKYPIDSIFIPDKHEKTIAQLNEQEWLDLWDNTRFERLATYLRESKNQT